MRWKSKLIKRPPIHGDRKLVKRFAWFPVTLDDGYSIWFEHYKTLEEYDCYGDDFYERSKWRVIKKFQPHQPADNFKHIDHARY